MENLAIGTKLYHYCYGPMTVVAIDDKYITTTVDDPDGFSEALKSGSPSPVLLSREHRWIKECVGHWVFLTPGEIGTENNNFDTPYQPGTAIKYNRDLLHKAFAKKSTPSKSTVGVVETSKESTLGVVEEGLDPVTGESTVGVLE